MSFSPLQIDEIEILVSFGLDEGLVPEDGGQEAVDLLMTTQGLAGLEYYGERARTMFPATFDQRDFEPWSAENPTMLAVMADHYWYNNIGYSGWAGSPAQHLLGGLKLSISQRLAEQNPTLPPAAAEAQALNQYSRKPMLVRHRYSAMRGPQAPRMP